MVESGSATEAGNHHRGSVDLSSKQNDSRNGDYGNSMHHRARRLFGRTGPRHSTHLPGDSLQTVEESLTMQYLNTQRQKEALLLAESADFVSYNGGKEAPTLRAASPWHNPKEAGHTSFDAESGGSSNKTSWSKQDGEKSDLEGQVTSGSFSSAGGPGSFKLNSRESSGNQNEVVRIGDENSNEKLTLTDELSKPLNVVVESDDRSDTMSDVCSQYAFSVASEDTDTSRHGAKTKRKKPKPKNAKYAAMLYQNVAPALSQLVETYSNENSQKSSPISHEHENDNSRSPLPDSGVLPSSDMKAPTGKETPVRRLSGKDPSLPESLSESKKEKTGKIWSWKKLGMKRSSKKVHNPLEEQLDDDDEDAFKERSPLEDAAQMPMAFIPSVSQEEEVLADLPSDVSMPSSKAGSFRKYAGSDGPSRDSLRNSARVGSEPQERIMISKLAQARAARLPQSIQYPVPTKDRSVAASILQEIDKMRHDAEEAEKKLLAAERLAQRALILEASQSGTLLPDENTQFPPVSLYSSRSARSKSGERENLTGSGSKVELKDALEEASKSLAAADAELRERKAPSSSTMKQYRMYTWQEIRNATNNFDRLLGEGGFGTVYHGVLNHTPVAVKVMKNTTEINAEYEFKQEVEVLGELRHPHVMMLLGCCPEKYCLVYEYMANGSLDDRLRCVGNTPPLAWYTRLRICAEVASALLNLHSRPEPIVHRDLKPANVLLDKNFVAKLGDVGLAKIMPKNGLEGEYLHESKPVGTLAYVDPEFQRTGDFSPKSDVYAFGIVLMDVLTGRNPKVYEIIEDAVEAENPGQLAPLLDKSAGDWPINVAMEVANLAVRCSEMKRKKRPELESEVMPILDKIHAYASSVEEEVTKGRGAKSSKPPSCLFCPITQEIMVDPMIASDGHTYEAHAIQHWLQNNERSPITNQRLPNKDLLPNLAVKTMIKEWKAEHSNHH